LRGDRNTSEGGLMKYRTECLPGAGKLVSFPILPISPS
jgi:hypothetical protein